MVEVPVKLFYFYVDIEYDRIIRQADWRQVIPNDVANDVEINP